MASPVLRRCVAGVLDLLAPVRCPLCGGKIGVGCRCRCCRVPQPGWVIRELRWSPQGPFLLLAGGPFAGRLRRLVHAHKYGHEPGARSLLAAQAALAIPAGLLWEALVPVPSHRTRVRERGGDSAGELTRSLSASLGLPVRPLLRRRRYTEPLVGQRRSQRQSIVAQVFRARRAAGCLLLVDDVRTTGATQAACRRVLLAAGARAVDLLVAAQTPDRILRWRRARIEGLGGV